MPTIEKIVMSSFPHQNLVKRDRGFEGTGWKRYFYQDTHNVGPANTYTFSNLRTTYQPVPWNYRELRKRHKNATTRLEGEKVIIVPSNNTWDASWTAWDSVKGKLTQQYDRGSGMIPNYYSAPLTPGYDVHPDAALEAKMRLLNQLKDKRQAWEGMVFLGELTELLHMVRNPAQSLRSGLAEWIDSAKKLRRRRSASAGLNRALAGSWLEWVYGISPTLGDLENAQEALNRHIDRYESLYQRFSSRSEEVKTSPQDWLGYVTSYYPWTFNCRYRKYLSSSIGYYGQVYTIASNTKGFTRQQLGFELRNFVPTVWELIPYSFVADYFANIGGILSGLSTYTGDVAWISQNIVNEGVVEHIWQKGQWSFNGPLNPAPGTVTGLRVIVNASSSLIVKRRKVHRTALAGVPTVNPFKDFRIKIPGVGSTKWINLLALFSAGRSTERLLRGGRS